MSYIHTLSTCSEAKKNFIAVLTLLCILVFNILSPGISHATRVYLSSSHYSGIAPLEVELTVSATSDTRQVLSFTIFYGDGTQETVETNEFTYTFTHTYQAGYFRPYCAATMTSGTSPQSDPIPIIVGLWRFKTGDDVDSSPAIGPGGTNGIVYVGSDDGNLYALDAQTGAELWKFQTGSRIQASPVVDTSEDEEGIIYFGSTDGKLYALNAQGRLIWQVDFGEPIYTSPAVGEYIYVGVSDNRLYSVTTSGTIGRSFAVDGAIVSSPSIGFDGKQEIVYFGCTDNYLYAVYGDSMRLKWKFRTNAPVYGSPAIAADGRIYFGECQLHSANDYNFSFYCLDIDGTLDWWLDTGVGVYGSPVIGNDLVFFGTVNNQFYAMFLDGGVAWSLQGNDDFNSAPAVGDNGIVYAGNNNGSFYAIQEPDPRRDPKDRRDWALITGDAILSSPAIGPDGTIYFGSRDDYVYAVRPNDMSGPEGQWPMFRYNWKHTGKAEGIKIPDIISTVPSRNDAEVPITTNKITINFASHISRSDIDVGSFVLEKTDNKTGEKIQVDGSADLDVLDDDILAVTFTLPKGISLEYDTTYTAKIYYTPPVTETEEDTGESTPERQIFSYDFRTELEPEEDPNPDPTAAFCFVQTLLQ